MSPFLSSYGGNHGCAVSDIRLTVHDTTRSRSRMTPGIDNYTLDAYLRYASSVVHLPPHTGSISASSLYRGRALSLYLGYHVSVSWIRYRATGDVHHSVIYVAYHFLAHSRLRADSAARASADKVTSLLPASWLTTGWLSRSAVMSYLGEPRVNVRDRVRDKVRRLQIEGS